MPIQIIVTGNDATEVRDHLLGFLINREAPKVEHIAEENHQAQPGNGAAGGETHDAPKRTRGRPSKPKPEESPAQDQAAADAETQAEVADETQAEDIEAARDRVRDALNTYYVDMYGMDFTIPDVLAMYKMRFTDGSVTKVSDIPAGMHDTVIQDIKDMSKTNHFKRKRIDL